MIRACQTFPEIDKTLRWLPWARQSANRLSKNISQEKLALLAEVDRSYVGRVERGADNVAILTLAKLAVALDTSLAKLMHKAEL